uniref:RanBD1 domain-containing protein n=1 Tax=Anopheles culicifacies TaxID=139723 RepID=A0A182M784_9DIPT
MAKRGPQSSLNHLNWNETDEPEEKGEFAKASDDVLKQRVIKKARRRVATDAADSTAPAASTSVFGAFKGFASTPLAKSVDKPDGAPTFSFLSGLGAGTAKTNGNGTATVSSSGADSGAAGSTKPMFSFGVDSGTKEQEKKSISIPLATTKPTAATTPVTPKSTVTTDVDKTVKSNVIALNKAFVAWITQKCNENAYCSLIPVFKNYEEYFAEINVTKQHSTAETSTSNSEASKLSFASKSDTPTVASLQTSMAASPVAKESEKAKEKTGFFFGTSASKESPTATKTVSLAAPPTTTEGFTFGGTAKPLTFGGFSTAANTTNTTASPNNNLSSVSTSSPSFFAGASTFASKSQSFGGFTFGNVVKPPAPDSSAASDNKDGGGGGDGGEADEDEPPKVEFTPVEEKDSLYSKRCKLFVKAGGSYSDRGVGTLHVKMVDGKVQVLVRADTSLGNILLNIILNESVPLQRLGKNNVMMICLPTPDSKPPPTSVLLRVKTTEEADQLYESLLKYKPK